MPTRPWEYESKTGRTRRLARDFASRARRSGFSELARDSLRVRGIDPDTVSSLSAPVTVDRQLVDRSTIRAVAPEADVRPTERALKPKETPPQEVKRRGAPSGRFVRNVLREYYPGHEDDVEVEYVPGRGTFFTLNGVPRLFEEPSLTIQELHGRNVAEDVLTYGPDRLPEDSPIRGAVSSPGVDILKGVGKVAELGARRDIERLIPGPASERTQQLEEEVSLGTQKEVTSILQTAEPLEYTRKQFGRPIARVALEPLALTADAFNAISPVDAPITGGQLRGGIAVEVLSYITDPLNAAIFPGLAIKAARGAAILSKAGAKGAVRATLKEAQALRKAIPKAQRLLAEEAGGRAPKAIIPTGWTDEGGGLITRQVGGIRVESAVRPEHHMASIIGKGTANDTFAANRALAQLAVDTGKPVRTAVINEELLPVMRHSTNWREIERYFPEGWENARAVIERQMGRKITTPYEGTPQFELSVKTARSIVGGKAPRVGPAGEEVAQLQARVVEHQAAEARLARAEAKLKRADEAFRELNKGKLVRGRGDPGFEEFDLARREHAAAAADFDAVKLKPGEALALQFEQAKAAEGAVGRASPKLTKPVVVRESDDVKALRAKVSGDGIDPPPSPPPRIPGEPPPLLPGGQAPSTSLWRTIESGLFLSPRASNLMRKTAEVMGDAPAVRLFMKALTGPAALARVVPEIRAGVVYRRLQGIMDAELGQRLVGQEEAFNKIFTMGKDTSKVVVGGKEVAFGDYATDVLMGTRIGAPRGRFPVTAAQREWITTQKSLMDDIARQYEHVSGDELRLLGDDYWPRFVQGEDGRVSIRGRIGSKQSPVKDRHFREMEDSIARGTRYAVPAETVQLYGRAIQKMTRDKLLIQVMKQDKIGQPVIRQLGQQIKAFKAQIKAARPANLDELQQVEVLRNKVSNLQAVVASKKRTLVPAKQVLGPGFGKELLEPEAAKVLQEIIGPGLGGKPGTILRTATYVSSIPRFVVTGAMDVGQFFLQGATLLATDPDSWSRAVGHSLVSLYSPEHWSRYLKNSPEAVEAARYGIGRGGIEFLEITKRSAALGRLPGAGVIQAVFGAAPRSFETFIEGSRIFNFSSLARIQRAGVGKAPRGVLPTLERAAAGITKGELEGELIRISNYVKTKLGTTDLMGLGLSVTQRQVESAFMLYSPRYTRSVFGMLGWALSNGVPARDAQRALATMLFGGLSSFYGFARATGLSHDEAVERINPMSGGKFLALPIGGNEYGFGSSYRATLGFLGQLLKEDSWDFGSWEEAAFDNPLARYLRSRTAPTTGTLIDFIEGEDFLGQDVSLDAFIEDPSRLLDYAQDRFLPLNLEAILEARGPLWQKVLAGTVETVGGRAFPRSPFSLFREAREKVFQEKKILGERPYSGYDNYEDMAREHSPAASVIDTDPRVQQAQERLEHESRFKKETREQVGFKKLEETRELQREQQLEDDQVLRSGEVTVDIWKDNFRNRQREFFARREQIVDDFKLKFGKDREGVNAVVEEYFNVDVDNFVSVVDGGTDWDKFFAAREDVLSSLSSTDKRLVNSYLSRFNTPVVTEFRKAQDDLGEYWAIEDLVWSRFQERPEFAEFPTFSDFLASKAESLLNSGVPLSDVSRTLSRLAVVSRMTSTIGELRLRHRVANPKVDSLLVKWYGLVPAKEQRRSRGGRLRRAGR